MKYSIGEFSRISRLTVKTLRFYHEKGLLVPATVDRESGYRYYDDENLRTARTIVTLRDLEFSLADITEILSSTDRDVDIVRHLERRRESVRESVTHYRDLAKRIEQVIAMEREAREVEDMRPSLMTIDDRTIEPILVAGLRMKGRYRDCGEGFSRLAKLVGRYISGKPMLLCYDDEYREDDADFEPCFPIRRKITAEGVDVRQLPGRRCMTLHHRGPYDSIGEAYARAHAHAKARGYAFSLPSREVYLKGPGLLWKGNPKRYLTEIQLPIEE